MAAFHAAQTKDVLVKLQLLWTGSAYCERSGEMFRNLEALRTPFVRLEKALLNPKRLPMIFRLDELRKTRQAMMQNLQDLEILMAEPLPMRNPHCYDGS